MTPLKITLTKEVSEVVVREAEEIGVTPEEYVDRIIFAVVGRPKTTFAEALEHTFKKNAELYRRLA